MDRYQGSSANDEEGDINPDSDASFLRRHRSIEEDDYENVEPVKQPGISQRAFDFMFRFPHLRGSTSTQDSAVYGLLPDNGPRSQSEQWEVAEDDIRKQDKRKFASSALRPAASFGNFGSRLRLDSMAFHSTTRMRGASLRGSSPMLIVEPGLPAGHGGPLGDGLHVATSEDEGGAGGDDVISIREDEDETDPPDNSPYPQVRASVAATDDTSASINTPRMWILSLLCALFGSATNLFFSLRYPSVAITPVIALVIVHPLGRAWDRLLKHSDDPPETFDHGELVRPVKLRDRVPGHSKKMRLRLWLAQGRWNAKEHACVYVSSNVSFGFAFATDVIVEQSKFYRQDLSIVYQLLLTISTQILGYSFAGLTRRYLVRPPSMIWPGTLMSTAMFTTMHSYDNKPANGWIVSRWKFFLIVWSGAFVWYFLPGLLMPALSYFSAATWFAPKNVVVANLVGCP